MSKTTIPEVVHTIQDDPEKAMRAERTAGKPEKVDDSFTAIRYVGDENGVPQFQVVFPKTSGFPIGKPIRGIQSIETVAGWPDGKEVDVVDVDEIDFFEQTDFDADPLDDSSGGDSE